MATASTPQRSKDQNRFYWGVVIPAFIASINEFQEHDRQKLLTVDRTIAHEYFKLRFAHGKSTKKMSVDLFNEYVDEVLLFTVQITIKVKQIKRHERQQANNSSL